MMQDSNHPFLMLRDPWDSAPCSGGEGSSARVLESVKIDSAPIRGDFPAAVVIMLVMRVEGEVLLSPDSRGMESST
jgi:hypothetical protein